MIQGFGMKLAVLTLSTFATLVSLAYVGSLNAPSAHSQICDSKPETVSLR